MTDREFLVGFEKWLWMLAIREQDLRIYTYFMDAIISARSTAEVQGSSKP